jgi:hypothetical protein
MNWDYIAGFFDGEGSLSTMNFTWRNTLANTVVCITQTGQEGWVVLNVMMVFLREHGIVSYISTQKRRANYRQMHHLKICARPSVRLFLDQMVSRVSVKKVVVQDTLRFIKVFPSIKGATTANRNRERGKYGAVNLDVEVVKQDRASGMKYVAIARKHGVDYYTIKKYLDPEYRHRYDAYRKKWRENQAAKLKAARQDVA